MAKTKLPSWKEAKMKIENVTTIMLTGRDTRLAMTNNGLRVDLPAGTVAVVIQVGQDETKEVVESR